jgi:hypothetical protein
LTESHLSSFDRLRMRVFEDFLTLSLSKGEEIRIAFKKLR